MNLPWTDEGAGANLVQTECHDWLRMMGQPRSFPTQRILSRECPRNV